MNRIAAGLAFVLALIGCNGPAQPQASSAEKKTVRGETGTLENGNLLNIVFGATVVDRDSEFSLEASAAHAIDGSDLTAWRSAPGGPLTCVIALAAPTRIRRLGASIPAASAATLHIEASVDGTTWTKALERKIEPNVDAPQIADVTPVVARYLRVTLESPQYANGITSLHAIGEEVAPYVQPDIEGCWEVNGEPARFTRRGAAVFGTIGTMAVDGGSDGRVYRLTWLERPMWGYAAVSVSPDGQHLSGVRWHEEVNPKQNGDGWLGARVPCRGGAAIDDARLVDAVIGRTGMWRMFGVRFDRQDRLMAEESAQTLDLAAKLIREHPQHRFRIVAREFRAPSDARNEARCGLKLAEVRKALAARGADLSRVEFVSAGTQRSALAVDFTSQRAMDSGVDLQVVPR